MEKLTVLIADDETFVRDSLADLLDSEGYRPLAASDAREALEMLDSEAPSAIVTDLSMPHGGGLELLRQAVARGFRGPVIVLTGVGTVADAVGAMKSGAYDFIQKPVEPAQFLHLLQRALEHRELETEVAHLRETVESLRGPGAILGASAAMDLVRELIGQVAPRDTTVLITGESGCGKELVAAAIHLQSSRARRSFVSVNCAAIPEHLFESEFFGHRKGSFTSAIADRMGRFAEAEGGTLVLDEVATLPEGMQAKLLRVLETGEYQVVGDSRTRRADVRVVAVTNEDLADRVRRGTFRTDLFYRLNVFPIAVPPLRDRGGDIDILADHFLSLARGQPRPRSARGAVAGDPVLSPESRALLREHDWPGNVRELRNLVERAVILAGGKVPDHEVFRRALGTPAVHAATEPPSAMDDESFNIRARVEALERRLIEAALRRTSGRRAKAAALLGIDPKNLGYYLRKHGMAQEEREEGEA